MTTKMYLNNKFLLAGITLKNPHIAENNNMALHCCDNPLSVLQNRQQLTDQLSTDLDRIVLANQTHSANFHRVSKSDIGKGSISTETAINNTDALYTFEPNVLLGTFTADCVPVIFYEESRGLIGVIHSGWQGTVKEISSVVMSQLTGVERIDPTKIQIHIGRALSQEKFEVDEDVYLKFKGLRYAEPFMYYNDATAKYHIDNQQIVKTQFELAGVPSDNITIDPTCTFLNDDGFSYRQNRADGRHMTFIQRNI